MPRSVKTHASLMKCTSFFSARSASAVFKSSWTFWFSYLGRSLCGGSRCVAPFAFLCLLVRLSLRGRVLGHWFSQRSPTRIGLPPECASKLQLETKFPRLRNCHNWLALR
jgi:hypothetical protein